jgi:hypothetical protein
MPVLNRKLAGDDGGSRVIAIFKEFKQVSSVFITEGRESPVVT